MLKIFSPGWVAGSVAGWMDQVEIRLNSVEVEVEAELGKNKLIFKLRCRVTDVKENKISSYFKNFFKFRQFFTNFIKFL